ncbi:Arm DNA-binding domain-containing protein [Tardiphaga sp.]|uniref:Arm DNA-binding domain-containing protein n=1 Tax=Tardiphaga sp. TaxID=1926292 RepID=UPI00352A15B3
MGLTALAIRNAKPRAKLYKLADERSPFLLVMPNGAKYWRLSATIMQVSLQSR